MIAPPPSVIAISAPVLRASSSPPSAPNAIPARTSVTPAPSQTPGATRGAPLGIATAGGSSASVLTVGVEAAARLVAGGRQRGGEDHGERGEQRRRELAD